MSLTRSTRQAYLQLARTLKYPSNLSKGRNVSAVDTPVKHEWIVILPDSEGALERRNKARPDHLKALIPRVAAGFWTFGGAVLEETEAPGEYLKVKGSVMLALAESKEQVLQALREDIFHTAGVWDWDKVQVLPFKTGIRKPL
ncbi:MAG: hypothetical protein FRX48_06137 [Lasallia pustulata]|uniref:YCII-related domain-containing protein n=1 Tax=Lasallia pustulata TaxID=136370 RepID=A0A5M8PPV0_9LECA|nr:MAG: hypothetical protein FRX48_06137 [Lasallia pustulata]